MSTDSCRPRGPATRRTRWWGVALVAALATGCGSTVQQAARVDELGATPAAGSGAGTTTAVGEAPQSAPGQVPGISGRAPSAAQAPTVAGGPSVVVGPVDRRPIKVGFLTIDYSKAYAAVGLSQGPAFDWKANYRALVDGLNKHGGLHGRRIVPAFYAIDGTAASYSTAAQAACTYLVQDQHVEVVLSYAASAQSMILSPCFQQAGVAQIDGNFGLREDTDGLAQTPGMISPEAVTVDRYAEALLIRAHDQGWLTSKNRLGVFVEGCPWDVRAYDRVVAPLSRRYGFAVEKFQTSCIVGWAEVSQSVSDVQSAALRFRADRVDRVMYLTIGESGLNGLFTQNAESQHWHPVYLLTSIAQPVNGARIGQIAPGQLPNTRGLGWLPGWDVDQPEWSPQQSAAQERCRTLAQSGGVRMPEPKGYQANLNPYMECDTLALLDRLLGLTGGATTFGTLTGAVGQLGSSYISPMTQGPTLFSAGRHAGASRAALFSYKASCSCFSYDTAPMAVP